MRMRSTGHSALVHWNGGAFGCAQSPFQPPTAIHTSGTRTSVQPNWTRNCMKSLIALAHSPPSMT